MKIYRTSDFDYQLPQELIAQYPLKDRAASRLLCVNKQTGSITASQFSEIANQIRPEDLLVLNNTKVIPARLFGVKKSGGKVECLVERIIDDHHIIAQIRASKSPKIGSELQLESAINARVIDRDESFFHLQIVNDEPILALLNQFGKIPLPPYIEREVETDDLQRYQTVYAKNLGAVAAPTAGLHFDEAILNKLKEQGTEIIYLTLHVGAGTYQPVRVDDLSQHKMHYEWMEVDEQACEAIQRCKARGGRVIAVGTTVVRSLETASREKLQPFSGETNLFITPGFQFNCVDAMITNFHLPKSTLLMLICAFGGFELMMQAYQQAIAGKFRFFSYGDAMFIE